MQDVYYRVIDSNPRYDASVIVSESVLCFPTHLQLQLLGLIPPKGLSNLHTETAYFTENHPATALKKEKPTRYGSMVMVTLLGAKIANVFEAFNRSDKSNGMATAIVTEYSQLLMKAVARTGIDIKNLTIEAGIIPYDSIYYQMPSR